MSAGKKAAILKQYRRLFGGEISPAALKLIEKEYRMNPGGPGAFERCVKSVAAKGTAASARGVCAAAGRAKYGAKKFAAMARTGKKKKTAAKKGRHNPALRIVPMTKARYERDVRPLLRAPYSSMPFAVYKRTAGRGMFMLYRGSELLKGGTKAELKRLWTSERANPGRRNPIDAAKARHEFFHGETPSRDDIYEVETPIHSHSVLSGIGKLKTLTIAAIDGVHEVKLNGFRGALLAQDEKGKQLFIEGGDQAVNLADFGITQPHEKEMLGTVLEIVYHTTKTHLRPEDGGTADYKHKFGTGRDGERRVNLTGRLPMASYDVRNKLIGIEGGTYTLPEVGIVG